jgi:hypothetical protein
MPVRSPIGRSAERGGSALKARTSEHVPRHSCGTSALLQLWHLRAANQPRDQVVKHGRQSAQVCLMSLVCCQTWSEDAKGAPDGPHHGPSGGARVDLPYASHSWVKVDERACRFAFRSRSPFHWCATDRAPPLARPEGSTPPGWAVCRTRPRSAEGRTSRPLKAWQPSWRRHEVPVGVGEGLAWPPLLPRR